MAYITSISSDYGCFRYSWIQVYGLQDSLYFSLFLVFLSSLWASFSGKVVSLLGRSGHHRPVLHLEKKRRYPHCTLLPTKISSKVPGLIDKTWVVPVPGWAEQHRRPVGCHRKHRVRMLDKHKHRISHQL